MTKHRSHSAAFKRQVAQEFISGETLHGLSKRHDVSRQLIRIWVGKYEAGALDDDVQAADLLQEYEAKINSGDLISIAEVVRDLHRSDTQPEQSYSERQLYESALDRMAREVAAIEQIDRDAAVDLLHKSLLKAA